MYRLKATRHGWERDRSPEYLVGFRTEAGKRAERLAKGRYRLSDAEPPIILTSDHPDAV